MSSLPENGVAIHGTSLSYAQFITRQGFKYWGKNSLNVGNYFFFFDTQSKIRSLRETLKSFYQAVNGAWAYGNGCEIPRIPAIVVFSPLKRPFLESRDLTHSEQGLVVPGHEFDAIPPERIFGYIEPALSEDGKIALQRKHYSGTMTVSITPAITVPESQPTSEVATISKPLTTPSVTPTLGTSSPTVNTYFTYSRYSKAEAHRILIQIAQLATSANL